ncbi:disulfide-isomerase tigA [Anopheles darlingi]|uniref:Disulfide-isomerase tigA n=1 Tax=Anopheles darlingi TaxID=43151 RepID=W5JV20_ANODA|nr:thioredoxin domain-containing protein 5 homolog [Anopheles darlingi]ETN67986.1 disulfide-isomerase tigA [Anopheles darlingi]
MFTMLSRVVVFRWFLLTLLLVLKVATGHPDTASVQLTKENFQSTIDAENVFVMFYAPWCDYCKKLAPIWAQLAEARNSVNSASSAKIARVDCTTDGDLCTQQEVSGYPTLKLFKMGTIVSEGASDGGIKYRGGRDLDQFNAFLTAQLARTASRDDEEVRAAGADSGDVHSIGMDGENEEEIPTPPIPLSPLIELTEDTFAKHISTGKHFVKFYAPWCGHCTKLAPTWEELAVSLEHERDIRVSKIDCTRFRPICTDFEVKGYPTLLWIEDGKKIEKYTGPRSHNELKQYVSQMAGGLQGASADGADSAKMEGVEKDNTSSSAVLQLGERDFAHAISRGVTVVKFYAPWCGHCMRLAPTWEQLAEKFTGRDGARIAKVDCTVDGNKELCGEQEVNGYPTVFLYRDGVKVTEYHGHRSLDDLYEFVLQNLTGQHDEL